jgi:hypothetical protein
MTENIITTKRGVYGRVNVTLPLAMKTTMLAWAKRAGMKKAEFLRTALTTGFLELSRGMPGPSADMQDELGVVAQSRSPASVSEDERPVQLTLPGLV